MQLDISLTIFMARNVEELTQSKAGQCLVPESNEQPLATSESRQMSITEVGET